MIESFRHKGLKRFFEADDRRGLNPQHKIGTVLAVINAAATLKDFDIPGFRHHPLSGKLDGFWAR